MHGIYNSSNPTLNHVIHLKGNTTTTTTTAAAATTTTTTKLHNTSHNANNPFSN